MTSTYLPIHVLILLDFQGFLQWIKLDSSVLRHTSKDDAPVYRVRKAVRGLIGRLCFPIVTRAVLKLITNDFSDGGSLFGYLEPVEIYLALVPKGWDIGYLEEMLCNVLHLCVTLDAEWGILNKWKTRNKFSLKMFSCLLVLLP